MNTDNANKYLDERQIYQRDVWDSKDIEHPLDCLLEDYHQEQLKLLGIADVVGRSEQLICDTCKSGLIDYPEINRRTCRCGGLGYNVTD